MKKILLLGLVIISLLSINMVVTAEDMVLRVGINAPDGTPETEGAKKFAEVLTELSGGQLTTRVLAGGLAGGERDIVEGQQLGTIESSVVCGILQNFDPAMMILEYEFLFKNDDHIRKVIYGPIGEKINERLVEKTGIRVLSVFMRTPRLLTTNRPINKLSDLQGLKVRVPEMPARVALWKALGANPTPLAFPEVYTALQTGTIDGQENPIGLIRSAKIYEAVHYLALTNHLPGFMLLTIAEDFYQSLNDQQKAWVDAAAQVAASYNDRLVAETEAADLNFIAEKMTVTRPDDMDQWREATKDVYKQFLNVEGFEELYNAIVEAGKNL